MSVLVATDLDFRKRSVQLIDEMWTSLNMEKMRWLENSREVRAYLSQTTTDDTEVGQSLPWKNKTTIPKLTQISDNLQAFYMSAMLSDEEWFRFEGADEKSHNKAQLIERWLRTKLRMGGFRDDLEKLVRDWIYYGNCFGGIQYTRQTVKSLVTEENLETFVGPKLFRISPLDVVIDPRAASFDDSLFIYRKWVPIVDIIRHNDRHPSIPYDPEAIENIKKFRGQGAPDDWIDFIKESGLQIDGFDLFADYLRSQYVEVLEFWGDVYLEDEGEVLENYVVTIADRMWELRRSPNPSWSGKKPFIHVGWRSVPDNLYGQGPMDNLVGMQYRVDHLENLKADTFDQIVHPALAIIGDEIDAGSFEWGPGARLYLPEGGSVTVLKPDASVLQTNSEIANYFNLMEEMAGSPREMAGFRTPGEKTAFEVGVLQQGAERLFNDRINHFESFGIERALQLMFEIGVRNMDPVDIARTFNDDTGALELLEFTRDDVVADGIFKAVGSKHFAARNKRIQELQGMLNMIQGIPSVAVHVSGWKIARMIEQELGFERYGLVDQHVAIQEELQSQVVASTLQQQVQAVSSGVAPPQDNMGMQGPVEIPQ
jgi:hypothetical protein